jgi:hypothetical protein
MKQIHKIPIQQLNHFYQSNYQEPKVSEEICKRQLVQVLHKQTFNREIQILTMLK